MLTRYYLSTLFAVYIQLLKARPIYTTKPTAIKLYKIAGRQTMPPRHRQPWPVSNADMNRPIILQNFAHSKRVELHLRTTYILGKSVDFWVVWMGVELSGFEVVNPQLVEEPPLKVVCPCNPAVCWFINCFNFSGSIDAYRYALLMESPFWP